MGKYKRGKKVNLKDVDIDEEDILAHHNFEELEEIDTENKSNKRKRWQVEEENLLMSYFQNHIEDKTLPSKAECSKFLEEHQIGRSAESVKGFFRNKLKKLTCEVSSSVNRDI